MFTFIGHLVGTIVSGIIFPFRWLGHRLVPLARHNKKSIGEIAEVVENVAAAVENGSASLLPVLMDAEAAMVAAKAVSGMLSAFVPGAAQGLAVATLGLQGAEAVVREAGVVAHVIIVTATDLTKLDGVVTGVKQAFTNVPDVSVASAPVLATPGIAPGSDGTTTATTTVVTTVTTSTPDSPVS